MSDFNPFEAPTENSVAFSNIPGDIRGVLVKFRQQTTALGGLWIFFGVLCLALAGILTFFVSGGAATMPNREISVVLMATLGVMGAIWLGLGIATCYKQMWAVYIGLGISYLSLLGNLLRLNICGLIVIVLIIIQSHRVIGFAKQLRAAGVPLDSKP